MKKIAKKFVSVLMAVAMVFSLITISPVSTKADENEITADCENGEAVVLFKNAGISAYSSMSRVAKNLGSDITIDETYMFGSEATTLSAYNKENSDDSYIVAVVSSETLSTEKLIDTLNSKSYVSIAEPNYICKALDMDSATVNKALYSDYQWGMDAIETETAYENLGTTGTDYVVAVIDTGIDYLNEDLKDNLWINPYPSVLQGTYGMDFSGDNADGSPYDNNGHGTHVSGIIAGEGYNITGVTQQAKIMALKFLDSSGSGQISDAIAAYYYIYQALNLGVNVVAINNSWGAEGNSEILEKIVNTVGEKGAISVFAAGNDGIDIDGEINTDLSIMDSPYTVTVAATNEDGELASFSNYNIDNVDLAAPGADILSTVSYNCFNPSIYTDEQISELCADYNDFENEDAINGSFVADSSVTEEIGSEYTTEIVDGGFAGSSKALKISAEGKKGENLLFAIPYTVGATTVAPELSVMMKTDTPEVEEAVEYDGIYVTNSSLMWIYDVPASKIASYSEYMIGGMEVSGETNYWNHLEIQSNSGKTLKEQSRYLLFEIDCEADGDYTIYFDDFALSAANKEIDSSFGQYDYCSGTSMAAPFVTGAIALLSSQYNTDELSDKVIERVNEIKSSVVLSDDLAGKCVTGGILNLNTKEEGLPYIASVKLTDGVLTITGSKFAENPTVSITGSDGVTSDVQVAASTSTSIQINEMSAYNYQKVVVTVGSNGKATSRTIYLSDGQEYTFEGESQLLNESFSRSVTDGKDIYLYDEEYSGFYKYSLADDDYSFDNDYMYDFDLDWSDYYYDDYSEEDDIIYLTGLEAPTLTGLFPEKDRYNATVEIESDMVYVDDSIYAIASVSSYSDMGILYMTEYSLIKYTISTDTWSVVSDMPNTIGSIKNYGLTHYGQTLAAYNGYLYFIGGYNGQNATSDVVKYSVSSGKWSTAASLPEARIGGQCLQTGNKLVYTLGQANDDKKCPATLIFDGTSWKTSKSSLTPLVAGYEYSASISICKEGILYTGITCSGLGDTFIYNVSKDKYVSTGYSFANKAGNPSVTGVAVGDTLYAFSYDGDSMNVYSIPVNSGLVKVTASDYKYGYISGANEEVLPGTKVTIKAVAYSGAYFKTGTLKINGTAYTGKSKNIYVTANQKASATFVPYVSKLTLNKTSATMYYGVKNTLQLNVSKVTPSKADGTVTWSSSNTKYATVNSSGKVTIKKAGIGKTVTITAKAADGSKKTAKCKITILQPIKKLELTCSSTSVKAGNSVNIKATYSPKSNINKSLTWTVSNKKYASISSTGTLKTKKAGKGHTVTVTATSKDGKKVSAKIKIKIK